MPHSEAAIVQIIREASLTFCLPNNPFFQPQSQHAVQEATYAFCGAIFAQVGPSLRNLARSAALTARTKHFLNRLGVSYFALKGLLNESDANHASVLNQIKQRFRSETFTRQSILEVVHSNPELVRAVARAWTDDVLTFDRLSNPQIRELYVNFAVTHCASRSSPSCFVEEHVS